MRYIKFFTILIFSAFLFAENIHANEYIAFSLKVAQQMILSTPQGKDYRKLHPEVFTLGGITAMNGLVYDRKTGDVILVGQRDPDRAILTLDDFVVALRARFIHGKWPLVSIDPTPETEKTQMQVVRFEGGIEDTQFGQDLFDADYRLKQIGMGLLSSGVPGFKSGWDLGMEMAKQGKSGSRNISSRFWFYPVLPNVLVREDVVAIKGLKVGVFTEVLSAVIDRKKIEDPKTFQDTAGDEFAKQVTDKFEALSKSHPSFSRMHGLDEIIALVNAIENMDKKPDLDWWLTKYQVKSVKTRRQVKVLRKYENYQIPASGGYYDVYHELSGGVELMAISLRLKAGNVAALKEGVLKTKPKPDALIWGFVVGEWLIPTAPGMLKTEDVAPLFAQAFFLQQNKRYNDAITLYGKIIELVPDWDWAYSNRGVAYCCKSDYDRAIHDYNKALGINPMCAEAYSNRGNAYYEKGEYNSAIIDHNKAIEINPMIAGYYNNRGLVFHAKGNYDNAIFDFNNAVRINPSHDKAYFNRGNVYVDQGLYDQALSDYNKVLEIDPLCYQGYTNRGDIYGEMGLYNLAISDFNKALEINPQDIYALMNRSYVHLNKGMYDYAISDLSKAIEINPKYAQAYSVRGETYFKYGVYEQSLSDFSKAVEINPHDAVAIFNRGIVYDHLGQYNLAIKEFNRAIEIDPIFANAYHLRGLMFYIAKQVRFSKIVRQ